MQLLARAAAESDLADLVVSVARVLAYAIPIGLLVTRAIVMSRRYRGLPRAVAHAKRR